MLALFPCLAMVIFVAVNRIDNTDRTYRSDRYKLNKVLILFEAVPCRISLVLLHFCFLYRQKIFYQIEEKERINPLFHGQSMLFQVQVQLLLCLIILVLAQAGTATTTSSHYIRGEIVNTVNPASRTPPTSSSYTSPSSSTTSSSSPKMKQRNVNLKSILEFQTVKKFSGSRPTRKASS